MRLVIQKRTLDRVQAILRRADLLIRPELVIVEAISVGLDEMERELKRIDLARRQLLQVRPKRGSRKAGRKPAKPAASRPPPKKGRF